MHTVYKAGAVGKWASNFFKLLCLAPILLFNIMFLLSPPSTPNSSSGCPQQSLSPMVPKIVPIVKRLTAEELDKILLLVLWPNFDEDNIESFS